MNMLDVKLKVQLEDGEVVDMDGEELTGHLELHYPTWALVDIIDYLVTNDEGNPILLSGEAHRYEIIDIDEARKQANVPNYDATNYEGMGDSEDMINAWIEDINANLTGHIATDMQGGDSEFLVLI